MTHRIIFSHLVVSSIFLLGSMASSSCSSPAESLDEYLREGRFIEARELLDEEGAGSEAFSDAGPEALALRERFTSHIERSTAQEIDDLIARGSLHLALGLAQDRKSLCPWSDPLGALVERCLRMAQRIEATEQQWIIVMESGEATIKQARQFLNEIANDRPWILDSKIMPSLVEKASILLINGSAATIKSTQGRLEAEGTLTLASDLRLAGATSRDLDDLNKPLAILLRLPSANVPEAHLGADARMALQTALELIGEDGRFECSTKFAPCFEAAWGAFDDWHGSVHALILESSEVQFEELAAAELWTGIRGYGDRIRGPLAHAHLQLAATRAPQGFACVLALLHLNRARALDGTVASAEWFTIQSVALATLSATPAPEYYLEIDLGPKIDPEIRGLIEVALASALKSTEPGLSKLTYSATEDAIATVRVFAENAEFIVDMSGLREVRSRHFSHFEEVPNPQKQSLERQLDMAESTVDSRERAYDWAVNSHNAYPTQYSLSNVNMAYSSYKSAVNSYNTLVDRYNATSSTISNSVYLPYSFEQGEIRFGWSISVAAQVDERIIAPFSRSSIDRDFVRTGNKGTDETEAYREPDFLDIDISPSAGLDHLHKCIALIKESLYRELVALGSEVAPGLTEEEQNIVGVLAHPWGYQEGRAIGFQLPDWVQTSAKTLQLKRPEIAPPSTAISTSKATPAGPFDAESAALSLSRFVCQTSSGLGEARSHGTATLVGPEGLILTCAHVLTGPVLELEFFSGPWKGAYKGELVFVNTARDVALVRARGLTNEEWANIRIDNLSSQGEAIVAIGNSGLDIGGQNKGGISQGIVSNTHLERDGEEYLAADISIAQGSSGGPLFSLKTGELIGVVQLVATSPGFAASPSQVAATGYLCLAAPTQKLQEWLGIAIQR